MTCPICNGAGFLRRDVPISHPDFGKAIPCECKRREMIPSLREWSGLGRSQQNWTLDRFPGDPMALAKAREALATKQGIWVFWSPTFGVGKTGLLVAIVNACWGEHIPALYQSVPAMLDRLRQAYEKGDYPELMEDLKTVQILALDEFHRWHARPSRGEGRSARGGDSAEGASSWAAEKIFQIIEDRYVHWDERMTIVATNRSPQRGDRDPLASRFSDTLRSRIVPVRGGDLRPRAQSIEQSQPNGKEEPTA